jgi:hypothetical protein
MPQDPAPAGAARPGWARIDRVAGAALLVLAVVIVVEARALPVGSLARPGPGFWPIALAVCLAVAGLAVAARGGGSPPVAAAGWGDAPRAAAILAAAGLAAFALERIGYRLTILLLLLAYLGLLERRRPWLAVAVAAGVSFGSFYLFSDLLRVQLPRGPWGV